MRRMGQRILKRIDSTAARKRMAERGGFTLAEMMAAMLIMLIASGLIAQTMAFAVQQTRKQYDTDEAQQAYTELVTAIRADLEYATGDFDFNASKYTAEYQDFNITITINGESASENATPTPTPKDDGSVIVGVRIAKNSAELLKRTFTVIPADANLKISLSNMNTTGD